MNEPISSGFLGKLGKYTVEYHEHGNYLLTLQSFGDVVEIPEKLYHTPKVYDVEEVFKLDIDDLQIGDILNFGNYRLAYGYIVTYNDKNQLYLENYTIDDYFMIPHEVSKLFDDPVQSYDNHEDVAVVEMKFPHEYLEEAYGLTPDLDVPKDITFEYVTFADQLNIMDYTTGKGFTVELEEAYGDFVNYINKNLGRPH
jgi:hypothetical protein